MTSSQAVSGLPTDRYFAMASGVEKEMSVVDKPLRIHAALAAFLLCLGMAVSSTARAADNPASPDVDAMAVEAYIYAYPLVTVELTRRRLTNVVAPLGTMAPMGQFARLRTYPNASYRDVTAPNADTLYTYAYLDLSKEPWVVSLPDLKGRFAVFSIFDGWTTVFADPGKRTTGTGAQTFAITGPGWKGSLPAGMKEYKSATQVVLFNGKIYCTGTAEDYTQVHVLQDKVTAVPLSSYGKPYTPTAGKVDPTFDMKTLVRDQVNGMDGAAYFKLFADLLKTNPPYPEDAAMVAKLVKLGIVPGSDFDTAKVDPAVAQALAKAAKTALPRIAGWERQGVAAGDWRLENGWVTTTKTGPYGTDYVQRALIAMIGLYANLSQDSIYPVSNGPEVGQQYGGANRYVMHFNKGQMPPVNGFWSLTMYNAQYFFVDNPLNRYNVSSRSKFKTNADGSVDVYIQRDSPGKDKEANWLPAPAEQFILIMRMYWPRESVLDGSYKLPPVRKMQ
jgi:hypothetical protein